MWEGLAFWAAMAMVVYGAINAVLHAVALVRSLLRPAGGIAYLVLVRNQAERVEGVVRALARQESTDLLLVDMGSADDSPAILERLAIHYTHARFLRVDPADRSAALSAVFGVTGAPFVVLVDLGEGMEKEGKS